MTRAELDAMLAADFLTFDGLESFTYIDVATAGNTSHTVASCRKTFQLVKAFGQPAVKGYQIDSVGLTFPVANLTPTAKLGDQFTVNSLTYEVTEIAKKTSATRWQVTGERAFIETDFATTVTLQRATLGVDVAGSVTETWGNVGSYSAIEMQEDDVSDLANRLGTKSDMQATSYYMAQTVPILPMDRLLISGRPYRINMIGNQGRVARLLQVRVQLYG